MYIINVLVNIGKADRFIYENSQAIQTVLQNIQCLDDTLEQFLFKKNTRGFSESVSNLIKNITRENNYITVLFPDLFVGEPVRHAF